MHTHLRSFSVLWLVLVVQLAGAPLIAQVAAPTTQSQEAAAAQQVPVVQPAPPPPPGDANRPFGMTEEVGKQSLGTFEIDLHTIFALPLATGLGAALALRPRRRGTPKRSSQVVQTQIILAIIGALVMIVVGTSLARAFGVVGAAGLVRYRAKIEDPKDAGVMLTTLAVGLGCGIGLYGLAMFATVFLMVVLWTIESFEPSARQQFILEIKTKEALKLQPKLETLLRRRRVKFELREAKPDEISFMVEMPMDVKTDNVSAEIMALDPDPGTGVQWKSEKKKAA
ncbi:MAG TPA: DUF4956 domain-containing protein [Vicinamibacterales bacterium]|nr:DUF4956 domain-containing protein [Vicinamibacterales bacterium]